MGLFGFKFIWGIFRFQRQQIEAFHNHHNQLNQDASIKLINSNSPQQRSTWRSRNSNKGSTKEWWVWRMGFPSHYPQVVSELSLEFPLFEKLDKLHVRCIKSQYICKLYPQLRPLGIFSSDSWESAISFCFQKPELDKIRGVEQKMKTHWSVHMKKASIFQY